MELRDTRLSDPKDLPDLLQGQTFVVVEPDDDALALRQPLYRADERLLDDSDPVGPRRIGRLSVLDGVYQIDLVLTRSGRIPELVERDYRGTADLVEHVLVLVCAYA